ncbi:putative zinc-binding metallopeptidase [Reichenbachiella agarivorans]|uniref:Zinc-binding metallopeptidase n=1 Tax=Reichenbachiella agarivorans TaxID=2979464 RepID=A0ABY6CLM2_9BACT|nr:substrate import-associated zinc metallohydrolase lipoprotein [Reichenbachiella agarivorans]UXP31413.1 putative zinc-binding metallopeptidase [Reichenbachiella agarivorans]
MMRSRLNIPFLKRGKFFVCLLLLTACLHDEKLNEPVKEGDEPTSALDVYIDENFTQAYNIAVRYKYVDNYVDPGQRVAPPILDVVKPMLDFVQEYWIDVYLAVENGEAFFRRYVPAELIFLGGLIYNGDGTVTLGTADAGARITYTNVNGFDLDDPDWLQLQLQVTYHEFAHIVHQEFSLPSGFENISPAGYSSAGSWYNLTEEEALQRGFVSPYATSSVNEDFAETIAFYVFDASFFEHYINLDADCVTADCENDNAGKEKIFEKLTSIKEHYLKVTGVDLDDLRAELQSKL